MTFELPKPTAYIWHQHLGVASKSLRWSPPNQWEYATAVDPLFTADQLREAVREALEEAAQACMALQDNAEEAKALAKFQEAGSDSDALSRGKHWAMVNLFNVALNKAAAAIRALQEDKARAHEGSHTKEGG